MAVNMWTRVKECEQTKAGKLDLAQCKLEVVPRNLGTLAQHLVDLNLSGNSLVELPSDIGALQNLRFLNLQKNALTYLPDQICNLSKLYRLGLKSNKLVELPTEMGNLASLVELFVTDNKLVCLPNSICKCSRLVKLQASRNQLMHLPENIGCLEDLELLRVAMNRLEWVPDSLGRAPKLAWLSLGGNPISPHPTTQAKHTIEEIALSDLMVGELLGSGASGDVYHVVWRGRPCALKQFRSGADNVSPDGCHEDEVALQVLMDHPSLTRVEARVRDPESLVMRLEHGKPMALKPDLISLLRCRWAPGTCFKLGYALQAILDTATALEYLHEAVGVCHGDVYAHNCIAGADGHTVLCDYGASFMYPRSQKETWERMEVRAWGLFMSDVLERVDAEIKVEHATIMESLRGLLKQCLAASPERRPLFCDIVKLLACMRA